MNRRFARFACIDWSGAKGERQKGIAVAISDGPGRTPFNPKRGRANITT